MADKFDSRTRSKIMSKIKSKNTSLELFFKKLLIKNKLNGFKMHPKIIGNPDIAFVKNRILIFIDGDFWHGYNWKKLHKIPPKKYWQAKIKKNIVRDKKYARQLKKESWIVLRFWEHDIRKRPEICLKKILKYMPLPC